MIAGCEKKQQNRVHAQQSNGYKHSFINLATDTVQRKS